MKVDIDPKLIPGALAGDLVALEALLRGLQPVIYNLAIRMLGNREDAQDASQEILLKVTTHLGTFRGDSAVSTWVYSIASRHLLNTVARSPRRSELSFEQLSDQLDQGLAYARRVDAVSEPMSPEDLLEARRTALGCTQAMLMCLDQAQRLAYVLDVVFGLNSPQAAEVQGISPAAHRQRLSRAKAAVHQFMQERCGLVSSEAVCRCHLQSPAKQVAAARGGMTIGLRIDDDDVKRAERALNDLLAMGDAVAAMRASPEYQAPAAMFAGIRLVVQSSPMMRH